MRRESLALLMVGGFGKRLLPLTKHTPKPLLKVGRKPLLEFIVEQLAEGGFYRICMATHYKSNLIRSYFGDGQAWGVDITYIEESDPLGTAGALTLVEPKYLTEPILVMNGDILTRLNFGQLFEFHESNTAHATMCVRECEFQVPYGVVEGNGERVSRIVEKPLKTYSVNAGIYVLDQSIVRNRSGSPEYCDMTDLLNEMMSSGGAVNRFPIKEYWMDIGQIEEYEKAQTEHPR